MSRKSKCNRNRKTASTTTLRCRQGCAEDQQRMRMLFQLAIGLARAMVNDRPSQAKPDGGTPHFLPRMDMMHDSNSKRTVTIFELPGVRNDEMKLHAYNGQLHVQGTRLRRAPQEYTTGESIVKVECSEPMIDSDQYEYQELRYGSFLREVELPPGVKESEMAATLRDGLLIVTWPTPELHPPKPESKPVLVDEPSVHDKSGTM